MSSTLRANVRLTKTPCKGTMVCDCPLCQAEIQQRRRDGVRVMPQPWRPKREPPKREAA